VGNPSIYAITVSKNYSKLLTILLSKNTRYFKKWFIVTQEDDTETINVIKKFNDPKIELVFYPLEPSKSKPEHKKSLLTSEEDLRLSIPNYLIPKTGKKLSQDQQTEYDKLTKNGVTFDKGGSLRQVQKILLPRVGVKNNDLVLMLDSDIVLPDDFGKYLSIPYKNDTMYVCDRVNYMFNSDLMKQHCNVDKNSLVGAGYFQLYKYDPTKLCKRTHTAGWVDWEFKNQFKNLTSIASLSVSHLGETDMNWAGKATETFLFDEELGEYCKQNGIAYSDDINVTKNNIVNYIRCCKLNSMTRKYGLPNYILFGNSFCGVNKIRLILEQDNNISSFQQTYSNLSFFGNEYAHDELWQKTIAKFYLKCFPKMSDHLWIDCIELDKSNTELHHKILDRLKITFFDKLKVWTEFNAPKIIFCSRNPINRSLRHYDNYMKNFPASHGWSWNYPYDSFEKNIVEGDDINNSSFVQNSMYVENIKWIVDVLKIPIQNILFIDCDADTEVLKKKIEDFMGINLQCNIKPVDNFSLNGDSVDTKTLDMLKQFFSQHNKTFLTYTGIDYNE